MPSPYRDAMTHLSFHMLRMLTCDTHAHRQIQQDYTSCSLTLRGSLSLFLSLSLSLARSLALSLSHTHTPHTHTARVYSLHPSRGLITSNTTVTIIGGTISLKCSVLRLDTALLLGTDFFENFCQAHLHATFHTHAASIALTV